ncbi:PTS sugar transporter subunit IIA [Amphibacillus sp. Q70]|uniref:PTS sugar transporter subunit IIA n=1 Tax=Amphibacillus sp. Q70 TaxID=3453416 RepID=UPI003F83E043
MKLVMTSHGNFCEGLLDSYKMIAGETNQIVTIKLTDKGVGDYSERLNAKLEELIKEDKVLIFCDVKGGTPYNQSNSFFMRHPKNVRVVSGMNLPMLIETALMLNSSDDLDGLAEAAINIGKNGIETIIEEEEFTDDLEF